MDEPIKWALLGSGLILGVLMVTSAWLKSNYFYYATVIVLTAWIAQVAFVALIDFEGGKIAFALFLVVLLLVYFFFLYIFTYKFVLREAFLRVIDPEKLKRYILCKQKLSIFDRTLIYMPYMLFSLMMVAFAGSFLVEY